MAKTFATLLLLHLVMLPAFCCGENAAPARHGWQGVDEAVVEKIARDHGRSAQRPLLDPGEGDLLLFAFLCAGAVGGFAAGYYWRELIAKK